MRHFNLFVLIAALLFYSSYGFAQERFTAPLSPEQEVHEVTSEASGLVSLQLTETDSLIVEGRFSNLMSPVDTNIVGGAHIHIGPAGRNGPVAIPLNLQLAADGKSGTFHPEDNRFALDAAAVMQLKQRQLYINIHSLNEAAGELRGQILPRGPQIQFVSLSGDQEVPPIMSPGSGAVMAEIYSDSLIISGSFSNMQGMLDTSIAGGVHLHSGSMGENGPVEFLLNPTIDTGFTGGVFAPEENIISITENEKIGLTLGSYYVNIHSTVFPGGELRGQLGSILNSENYQAQLTGRQEVHAVMTAASGTVDAMLVDDLLIVSGSFSKLQAPVDTNIAGGAHIHMALAGSNGPVIFPLNLDLNADGTSGQFSMSENVFTLTNEQIQAIENREFYINIHTTKWAAGELRGQLLPEANGYYFVKLLGSHEVPSAMTMAQGALAIEMNEREIVVSGSFENLEGELATDIIGGMHLHEGRPGENGPVLFPLDVLPSVDLTAGQILAADNRLELEMGQEMLLREKMIYANVHSTAFPGGEIRGQVTDIQSQVVFRAHLSGMNEIPTAMSPGQGQVLAEWQNDMIRVNGAFRNLSSNVATNIAGGIHLHDGMAGQNGPVLISLRPQLFNDSLAGSFSPMENAFSLSAEESMKLMNRGIYLNIHSANIPSGELRGQMLPESQIVFNAQLLSSQAVPNARSLGRGGLKLELNNDQLTVSGSYANLSEAVDTSIVGGFHIHAGAAGQTGPVEVVLNSEFSDGSLESAVLTAESNKFSLSEEQVKQMRGRDLYTNLHTQTFAAGELRGQILPEATNYYYAPLSGVAQVPSPVNTSSTGMAIMELTGNQSKLSGSFSNLTAAVDTTIAGGIHIHENFAGSNGPVIKLLNTDFDSDLTGGTFDVADNTIEWTATDLVTLNERGFYINVHSREFGAGEIRGQLLPPTQVFLRSNFSGLNEVQPIESEASGGALVEVSENGFVVSGSFDNLQSALNTNIAGGIHIHEGNAGVNGGVEYLISTTLDADSLNGVFLPRMNRFDAEETDVRALIEGNRYFNIHSQVFPGGELRGQILQEINFFPSASPEILSPPNGSELTINGDTTQIVDIQWADEGVDGNEVVYLWELATDASFDSTVVLINVGKETSLQVSYGELGNLLEMLDIRMGDTLSVFHRVVTSDGSVMTAGIGARVVLQNGTTTSAEGVSLSKGYEFTVFPTVSDGRIQIQLSRPRGSISNANQEIVVRNALGQTIDVLPVNSRGTESRKSYQFDTQSSGMYFLNWMQEGKVLSTQKVILK